MGAIQRTLAMALSLALGPAFLLPGCGGSGEVLSAVAPVQGDAAVPEGVAKELRACAMEHAAHLGRSSHSITFVVRLGNDGEVDSVALPASTLADDDLEACMAHALRSLSEDEILRLRAEDLPRGPVAPQARALVGHPGALVAAACLAEPLGCLLAMGIAAVGAYYIGVQIYVHAPAHPGVRTHHHHPPAVAMATTVPTTTAPTMPTTLPLTDQDLWRKCTQQHDIYKATQDEASDLTRQMDSIENLLHNNKAPAQQRVEYCSLLDKRIKLKQREHKERLKYIELDCDRFDWFNTGTTKAQRLTWHQDQLNNVGIQLKNLYALNKRFCQ